MDNERHVQLLGGLEDRVVYAVSMKPVQADSGKERPYEPKLGNGSSQLCLGQDRVLERQDGNAAQPG